MDEDWVSRYRAYNNEFEKRLVQDGGKHEAEVRELELLCVQQQQKTLSDAQLAKLFVHRLNKLGAKIRSTSVLSPFDRASVIEELAALGEEIEERLGR